MNVLRIAEECRSKEPFYQNNRVRGERGEKGSPHTSRPTQVTSESVSKKKKTGCFSSEEEAEKHERARHGTVARYYDDGDRE